MTTPLRVVACFVWHKDTFVILKRQIHCAQPLTWGLPAGKIELEEKDVDAAVRETMEETGIVCDPAQMQSLGAFSFPVPQKKNRTFVLSTFAYHLPDEMLPSIVLQPGEHMDSKWVTPKECDAMPDLIVGFHDLLRHCKYIVG